MTDFDTMAQLNVTYRRQNGSLPDMVNYDLSDEALKRIAAEAITAGGVPGIDQQDASEADFDSYAIDRYPAADELPCRLVCRPKTPVGST